MNKSNPIIIFLFLLVFCSFCAPCFTFAGFGDWQLRNPSAQIIQLQDVCYGREKYVAYTIEGLVYSKDLKTWEKAGGEHALYPVDKIKYLNGTFYGLSNGGPNYSSADGITWQEEPIPSSGNIRDIAQGKSVLVAVGDDGIFVAEQGKSWNRIESSAGLKLTCVAFGNGFFIAAGKGGAALISQNGTDWTTVNTGFKDNFTAIAYGNGNFVAFTWLVTETATGAIIGPAKHLSTVNGITWTLPKEFKGYPKEAILWKNGRYWSVFTDSVRSFIDGSEWEIISEHNNTLAIGKIFEAGDLFVATGNGLFTSDDGRKWSSVASGTLNNLNDVIYANGLFVAVGSGGVIVTSSDGRKWQERQPKRSSFSYPLKTVFEMKGTFVAIGPAAVFKSTDGIQWDEEPAPQWKFLQAAKGEDSLIVVGFDGMIMRSTDMKNWSLIESGIKDAIVDVAYGSGIFVAITDQGTILKSNDEGKSWTVHNINKLLRHICFGRGLFLLQSSERRIHGEQYFFSSGDGVTWEEIHPQEPLEWPIESLRYVGGTFIATTIGTTIYSSLDGRVWETSDAKSLGGLNSVAFGKNSYVAVGTAGKIFQAEATR